MKTQVKIKYTIKDSELTGTWYNLMYTIPIRETNYSNIKRLIKFVNRTFENRFKQINAEPNRKYIDYWADKTSEV